MPERPADPPRYRVLHVYLAQPALLLSGAPEIHDDDAVMQELRRAVEAGEIRNRIVVGAAYLPPLAGLISGQIVGELWRSDSVNYAGGVFEHPPGVYRGIEICEEDAQAHFRAWSPQKQSPAPQPKAALAEPTEPPALATTPHDPELTPAVSAARPTREWRPGEAPRNHPERVAQVLYDLHQSHEINATSPPGVYDMAMKVQTRLGLKSISKATFDRGLKLARKAVAASC